MKGLTKLLSFVNLTLSLAIHLTTYRQTRVSADIQRKPCFVYRHFDDLGDKVMGKRVNNSMSNDYSRFYLTKLVGHFDVM